MSILNATTMPIQLTQCSRIARAFLALGLFAAGAAAQPAGAVRIGRVVATLADGDDAYPITRPEGMARDAIGRLWVADLRENAVYLLDSAARPLARVGRKGAGPGEFASPCCLAIDAKGRLWVRDLGNKRYVVFTTRRTAPFATPAFVVALKSNAGGYTTRTVFDDAGRVIDEGTDNETRGMVRITIDSSGQERKRVTLPPPTSGISEVAKVPKKIEGGQAIFFLYPPFPGYALKATGPHGESATAGSGVYRIRWYNANGALLREIVRADLGPVVTATERREADSALVAEARALGTTPAAVGFTTPARKPPLRALWFDADGQLWVELSTTRGGARRAHVYSRTGRLAFIAEWPENVSLSSMSYVGGGDAWGVELDADGVPAIVRLRFSTR